MLLAEVVSLQLDVLAFNLEHVIEFRLKRFEIIGPNFLLLLVVPLVRLVLLEGLLKVQLRLVELASHLVVFVFLHLDLKAVFVH